MKSKQEAAQKFVGAVYSLMRDPSSNWLVHAREKALEIANELAENSMAGQVILSNSSRPRIHKKKSCK